MKKLFFILALVVAIAGCDSNKNNNEPAAIPNANCQDPNQMGCWPAYAQGGGYQQMGMQGCPYGTQPYLFMGYGWGCLPMGGQGYGNPYYQQVGYYNMGFNVQFQQMGYNQYGLACDLYQPTSCAPGSYCADVGMGRMGRCF